jgi:hypothetical protein
MAYQSALRRNAGMWIGLSVAGLQILTVPINAHERQL